MVVWLDTLLQLFKRVLSVSLVVRPLLAFATITTRCIALMLSQALSRHWQHEPVQPIGTLELLQLSFGHFLHSFSDLVDL